MRDAVLVFASSIACRSKLQSIVGQVMRSGNARSIFKKLFTDRPESAGSSSSLDETLRLPLMKPRAFLFLARGG